MEHLSLITERGGAGRTKNTLFWGASGVVRGFASLGRASIVASGSTSGGRELGGATGGKGIREKELERCGLRTGACGEGTGDRGLGTGNWGRNWGQGTGGREQTGDGKLGTGMQNKKHFFIFGPGGHTEGGLRRGGTKEG